MTVQRLRIKMRKLREMGEEMAEESGELNLIPYLDIVVNIIMFLLATITFSAVMANINVNTPTTTVNPGPSQDQDKPKPDLNLLVSMSERGFTIAASGEKLYEGWSWDGEKLVQSTTNLPTIPLKNGEYDYERLTQQIKTIKDHYPEESRAIVNANPQITYEKVVTMMDAIRNDGAKVLFPEVLLSAGIN